MPEMKYASDGGDGSAISAVVDEKMEVKGKGYPGERKAEEDTKESTTMKRMANVEVRRRRRRKLLSLEMLQVTAGIASACFFFFFPVSRFLSHWLDKFTRRSCQLDQ